MSEEPKTVEELEQAVALEIVMKRNAENKRRVEEDRKKANSGVTRSYGLKKPK